MPLWGAYAEMLKSDIADLNNSGNSPFAGAVTAALFLKRFAPEKALWAHFDTFAWRPVGKPGRAKGGDALGLRAAWGMLQGRYGRAGR
jgi:leucyl aminopeptidase